MLALEVAASASSPRKRPTQMALTVPFSDWRIEQASVGSAKASRVWRSALRQVAALPFFARCVRHSAPLVSPAKAGVQAAATRSASAAHWIPAFAGMTIEPTQPLQRRAQPFGLGGFRFMVGAGLVDRFGLGALGEVGVGEALREAVAFLLGGLGAFRQARLLGVEVDMLGEREGIGLAADDDLRRAGGGEIRSPRRPELGHARKRRRTAR